MNMTEFNRKIPRLKNYDYSKPGFYYVTICVQDRNKHFGNVINGQMQLNKFGKIADACWRDLPNHYTNCQLDEFVIMPNHFHGIIVIVPVGNGLKPFPTRTHALPEIIRGFKTFSSRRINELKQINFSWQKSFYDHIIRDEHDLDRIREYIRNNPKQWELDELNPNNVGTGFKPVPTKI